ncbi:MAG: hypothetical protein AMXMBFR55_16220 [Gemmatimonadota bacterium]
MADERSYVVQLADGTRTHLPEWMTGPGAGDAPTITTAPTVSVAALATLRTLLDAVSGVGKAEEHR